MDAFLKKTLHVTASKESFASAGYKRSKTLQVAPYLSLIFLFLMIDL